MKPFQKTLIVTLCSSMLFFNLIAMGQAGEEGVENFVNWMKDAKVGDCHC